MNCSRYSWPRSSSLRFPPRQIRRDPLEHLCRRDPRHAAGGRSAIRHDGVDEFGIGQHRRRAEQAERLRRAGSGEIERPRTRTDEQIGEAKSAAASFKSKSQALTIRTPAVEVVKFCARAVLAGPPIKKIVPGVFRPARNSRQAASGQSLSGCEAPIPSTIHGRVQSANLSSTVINTARGKCKSGSADGNGIFISAIKARSQSIG